MNIDYQNLKQRCEHCGGEYEVSQGSVYENAKGVSIYLATMHQCDNGKLVHLAIAVMQGYEDFEETCAILMQVIPTESEFGMIVLDPKDSPWQNEFYLGRIFNREEALKSSHIDTFFHIADHIVVENPEVNKYLNGI